MSFLTVILLTVFTVGQSSAQTGSNQKKERSSDSTQIKTSEADTPRIGRGYGKTPASSIPGIGSSTAADTVMVLPNPANNTPDAGIKPTKRTLRPRTETTPLPGSNKANTENKATGTTGTSGTGGQTTTPKP